jgi:hypothetical protein
MNIFDPHTCKDGQLPNADNTMKIYLLPNTEVMTPAGDPFFKSYSV